MFDLTPESVNRRASALAVAVCLCVGACGEGMGEGTGHAARGIGSSDGIEGGVDAIDRSAEVVDGSGYLVDKVADVLADDVEWDGIDFHCDFCELVVTREDVLARPRADGIVWYGVWRDAVAEVERTGKPMLLHFGSPRCMEVPGVW